ncbi:MAG: ABC transporter permease [Candidatus Caldarchaeum sp.]|nr:ABC transporter permease [Candidatus Caldarchaeum sp.]MDW8360132.1 ABC transporter permease [Candidatus Caldarchaeum sp.]
MKGQDYLKFAWSALKDRRLRTTLTVLGIVVGPALITALNATTAGLTQTIVSNLQVFGADMILVQRVGDFNFDDSVVNHIRQTKGVKEVYPYYLIASGEIKTRGKTFAMDPVRSYTVLAVNLKDLPNLFPNIRLEAGEVIDGPSYAVVGFSAWNPRDPDIPAIDVGSLFTASTGAATRSFSVSGRLDKYGQALFLNPDTQIFVSLEAGRLLTNRKSYSGAFIRITEPGLSDSIVLSIEEKYGENLRVFSITAIAATVQQIIGTLNVFFSSVASMSLLVAFLGIMTTMFTSVTERVREIGLVKALGFKTRDVMVNFITEALIIGLLGGVVGTAAGIATSFVLADIFSGPPAESRPGAFQVGGGNPEPIRISPIITPELVLTGVLVAVGVAILAGLIPAYRASKLEPMEALRRE